MDAAAGGDDTDCNDDDPDVHPGAEELCDEVDQDCDGEVDEGAAGDVLFYQDSDGDGYGDPDTSQTACIPPDETWTTDDQDCDDTDADVNPDAIEECNEVDDDCDGEVDNVDDGREC